MTWRIFLGLLAHIADKLHDYFSCPVLRSSIGSVGWLLYIRLPYGEDKPLFILWHQRYGEKQSLMSITKICQPKTSWSGATPFFPFVH